MEVLTYHESSVRIDALFALKDANLEKKDCRRHHMDGRHNITSHLEETHPPTGNEAYAIWIRKYQPSMKRITKCLEQKKVHDIYMD